MSQLITRWIHFLFILGFVVGFSFCGIANPIPVYPDPEPALVVSGGAEPFPIVWLGLIFIINFCVDILILYGGLVLLDRFHVLPEDYVLSLTKIVFFMSVGLISLIGLIVEYVLGAWVGGLLLAAGVIFCSFVFVGRWLLEISLVNGVRLGLFAVVVNIVLWTVFYSLF